MEKRTLRIRDISYRHIEEIRHDEFETLRTYLRQRGQMPSPTGLDCVNGCRKTDEWWGEMTKRYYGSSGEPLSSIYWRATSHRRKLQFLELDGTHCRKNLNVSELEAPICFSQGQNSPSFHLPIYQNKITFLNVVMKNYENLYT